MKKIIHSRDNLIYTFNGRPPEFLALPPQYEVTQVDERVLERFFSNSADARRCARYRKYLQANCLGTLIHNGSEWAAIGWLAPVSATSQPDHVPYFTRRIGDWFFEDHTATAHRGQGLHKRVIAYRLEQCAALSADGMAHAATDINPSNVVSRKSYTSMGFDLVRRYRACTALLPYVRRFPIGWSTPVPANSHQQGEL